MQSEKTHARLILILNEIVKVHSKSENVCFQTFGRVRPLPLGGVVSQLQEIKYTAKAYLVQMIDIHPTFLTALS